MTLLSEVTASQNIQLFDAVFMTSQHLHSLSIVVIVIVIAVVIVKLLFPKKSDCLTSRHIFPLDPHWFVNVFYRQFTCTGAICLFLHGTVISLEILVEEVLSFSRG